MAEKTPKPFSAEQKPTLTRFLGARHGLLALAGMLTLTGNTGAAELDATLRVCTAGPAAAVARAERLRGDAEVLSAGVLPNPSLVGEHQRTLRGPKEQETILGLSVPLGIGGGRFILQDAAASRRDQARASAAATLFDSALAFREAYLRAVTDQARVAVLAEQQAALESLSAAIQGLTKGGETAGYDLLRQQAEARRHRSSLEVARARAGASQTLLEAWSEVGGLVSGSELSSIASSTDALPSSGQQALSVLELEAAARASALEARAARRRWVPDLDAFVGYRTVSAGDETGQGISLGLSVPLTLFDHGQGEAARAEAEGAVALARANALRSELRAEARALRARLYGLSRARSELDQASAETTEIQLKARKLYAAGEASITELLEAFRTAEETALAKIELMAEVAAARLELMRALGTMFDARLDRACRSDAGRAAP
jgi:cobalt-zinc-cadmium efflux system outer membrane protein